MGRMIDTDAAYAVLTDYYHHTTDIQHAALKEALGRVESVDAVPVVRCKDCKHRSTEDNVWVCPFGLPGGPEFFCGYGVDGKDGDHEKAD